MQTLSKGYKRPETGDRGQTVFDALEDNITLANSHQHNGTDGVKVAPKDLDRTTQTLLAASWVAVAGQAGTYKQTITAPGGYTIDDSHLKFYRTGGSECHPTVIKLTATTAEVHIGNNTDELKVIYG